jgi:hypothetical protein
MTIKLNFFAVRIVVYLGRQMKLNPGYEVA